VLDSNVVKLFSDWVILSIEACVSVVFPWGKGPVFVIFSQLMFNSALRVILPMRAVISEASATSLILA